MRIVYSVLGESMVGIVIRLWAGQQRNHGSVPSKDKRFLFLFFLKHLHHPKQFTKSGQEILFSKI